MICFSIQLSICLKAKVLNEITRLVANEIPTYDELQQMDYLTMVLKEVLR